MLFKPFLDCAPTDGYRKIDVRRWSRDGFLSPGHGCLLVRFCSRHLKKYRAKAQLIVRVERVTVNGGGQDIVGP